MRRRREVKDAFCEGHSSLAFWLEDFPNHGSKTLKANVTFPAPGKTLLLAIA